eukprot:808536-Ditylum_brightwellii.AAC.2
MKAEMQGEMKSMQEEMEKTQEERNTKLMETTKEMINEHTAATNEAIDKVVKDQGTMMQNMMITERSHTDSKFDQVIQLLQLQLQQQAQGYSTQLMTSPDIMMHQANQYPTNFSQTPQFLMQSVHLTQEKMMMNPQLGSQVMQSGNGNSLALAAKNGGGYSQKDNPDSIVSPEHQPCAESIGGAQ